MTRKDYFSMFLVGAACLSLSACSGVESEAKYPTGAARDGLSGNEIYGEKKSIFGDGGLKILGGRKDKNVGAGENGIDVNSFLWRATLDTVSFMPLASADPFGGVILTDWYSDPANPNERVKVNAFILGRELKADGVRVRTFRQVQKSGQWQDAPVADETARKLEDAILTRARELRISHLAAEK
ncbi:MAG: DUF3576 domain-containing protein [Alphaproteobacteria bacterium]